MVKIRVIEKLFEYYPDLILPHFIGAKLYSLSDDIKLKRRMKGSKGE